MKLGKRITKLDMRCSQRSRTFPTGACSFGRASRVAIGGLLATRYGKRSDASCRRTCSALEVVSDKPESAVVRRVHHHVGIVFPPQADRKSTRLNSSHLGI